MRFVADDLFLVCVDRGEVLQAVLGDEVLRPFARAAPQERLHDIVGERLGVAADVGGELLIVDVIDQIRDRRLEGGVLDDRRQRRAEVDANGHIEGPVVAVFDTHLDDLPPGRRRGLCDRGVGQDGATDKAIRARWSPPTSSVTAARRSASYRSETSMVQDAVPGTRSAPGHTPERPPATGTVSVPPA